MKERKRKMINAKEAKKLSDNIAKQRANKALEWAKNELPFIEERINKKIEQGEYSAGYGWSAEDFKKADITRAEAKEAIVQILGKNGLGFKVEIAYNYTTNGSMSVFLDWEKV